MSFQTILHEIDAQMDQLQQARNLILASQGTTAPIGIDRVNASAQTSRKVLESLSSLAPSGAGMPTTLGRVQANSSQSAHAVQPTGVNRISQRPGMSEEARRRIGEATRKRWADKKKSAKK